MSANTWDRIVPHLQNLPFDDCQHLAVLNTVSGVQQWAKARADEYRKIALHLLSIHNDVASINRLPAEVLEIIFGMSTDHTTTIHLLHVCRQWRSILLNTPSLWTRAFAGWEICEERTVTITRDEKPHIAHFLYHCSWQLPMIRLSGFPQTISQVFSPYVHSLTALQVTVARVDLYDHLWPILGAGMPALETLSIQIVVPEEECVSFGRYDGYGRYWCWIHKATAWQGLSELSGGNLPSLLRLTCPHNLLGRFNVPTIRHLILKWWPRIPERGPHVPRIDVNTLLEYVARHRATLEVLEVLPARFSYDNSRDTQPVAFPVLRELRLATLAAGDAFLFTLMSLSTSARCYFCGPGVHGYLTYNLIPVDDHKLDLILGAIDGLHIQEATDNSAGELWNIRCYVRDTAHIHFEGVRPNSSKALPVFSGNIPILRLVLQLQTIVDLDLRIFPRLQFLQLETSFGEEFSKLQPEGPQSLVCPSLTELVVCFRPTMVDNLLDQVFTLEDVLSLRALLGSRIRSLKLCSRAPVPLYKRTVPIYLTCLGTPPLLDHLSCSVCRMLLTVL